ncbi:MAG: type IV pilus assembly protein PilM [Candidatus Nealsonbacteria bacterium]|nr:type IV pilus assembly protein PilM [Candidatus Nealsonbacteria bacterium]
MLDYLNLKPQAFGLDISDFSLKIIKLEKRGGLMALASFGEKTIKPGIIEEGEIKDGEALTEILREACKEVQGKRLNTKYVVASLPEERAFLQVIQMPKMKEDELKKAIRFEAENYVPLPIDNVYLDSQIVTPIVNHLDHLDALITALPQKTVDPYVTVLKRSGLKPLVLEMESQAISRALIAGGATTKSVLLIDMGASNTRLSIFAGHSLRFTSSIAFACRKLTETIAEALKISFQQAEKLKIQEGLDGQEILKPILTELAATIEKHLEYYQGYAAHEHLPSTGKEIEKIILSGGGANLKGLSEFLSARLKLPVELGNPWINIMPSPIKEVPELPYSESLRYTTALGLALQGLKYD